MATSNAHRADVHKNSSKPSKGSVQLCERYGVGRGMCDDMQCKAVHICRAHMAGFCGASAAGHECPYEHSLMTAENMKILISSNVELPPLTCTAQEEHLRATVSNMFARICPHYIYGKCSFGNACRFLHLCNRLHSFSHLHPATPNAFIYGIWAR